MASRRDPAEPLMTPQVINPAEVKRLAEQLYRGNKFLCSEAILFVINNQLGNPLPADIVKLASGFPRGIGGAGCTCGAVSGGIMALGLLLGRSEPEGTCPEVIPASKELHDWFKGKHKSLCCRVLAKNLTFNSPERKEHCINITGDVAEKTAELILKYSSKGERHGAA